MKTTAIVAIAAAAVGVAAQTIPDGTPACIVTCAKNMLAKTDLGCTAGDIACLCQNKDFGYGIRDCTWAACNNSQENLALALKWYSDACVAAGKPAPAIPTSPFTAADPTEGAGTTVAAGAPTPVTTSTFTSVITDASGSVTTQIGSTTINGINGTPGGSIVTSSITGTVFVSGPSFTSTLGPTTFETTSTVAPSDVVSSLSSAAAEATSSALGAQFTAAPAAGFLAAAGIAALLL